MKQIEVTIMGQSYILGCPEGGETSLLEAVGNVDREMGAIRDAGKVKGTDRIAVMAALSVAGEYFSVKAPQGPLSDMSLLEVQTRIGAMHKVLDAALTPQETLF